MKKIKTKLQSRVGASITFALLLFLVCAAVGSVVLVAGTAAAGRLSLAAEMDQRYYSVSSAAELLRDTLAGKTVEFKTETVKETVLVTNHGIAQTPTETTHDPVKTLLINGTPLSPDDSGIIAEALRSLSGNPSADRTKTLQLELKEGDTALDGMKVTVEETLRPDGTLVFLLYNTEGEPYKLRLTFSADLKRQNDTHTEVGTPVITNVDDTGFTQTVITTVTTTNTLTVVWTLDNLETLRASEVTP